MLAKRNVKLIGSVLFVSMCLHAASFAGPVEELVGEAPSPKRDGELGDNRFCAPSMSLACRYSPDGRFLVAGSSDHVSMWSSSSGELLWQTSTAKSFPRVIRFFPGGKRLLVGTWNDIFILKAEDGKVLVRIKSDGYFTQRAAMTAEGIGVYADKKGILHFVNQEGKEEKALNLPGPIKVDVCYTPGGEYALGIFGSHLDNNDGTEGFILNTESGRARKVTLPNVPMCACLLPGQRILIGYWGGTLEVRRLENFSVHSANVVSRSWVNRLEVLPGEKTVLVLSAGQMRLWNAETEVLTPYKGDVHNGQTIDDMHYHASSDRLLVTRRSNTRLSQWRLKKHQELTPTPVLATPAQLLAWSPDDSLLAAAGVYGSNVVLIDTETWKVVKQFPAKGVFQIAFSADGSRFGWLAGSGITVLASPAYDLKKAVGPFKGPMAFAFGQNGNRVLTFGYGKDLAGTVQTRSLPDFKPLDEEKPLKTLTPEMFAGLYGSTSANNYHWLNRRFFDHLPRPAALTGFLEYSLTVDPSEPKEIIEGPPVLPNAIPFLGGISEAGLYAALVSHRFGSGAVVLVCDRNTGKTVAALRDDRLNIFSAAISRNGKTLAVSTGGMKIYRYRMPQSIAAGPVSEVSVDRPNAGADESILK